MRRFLTSLLLPLQLFAQTETIHTNWTVVTIGDAIKPSFDFDAEGNIHVMGMTESFPGFSWHATADRLSGPWRPVEVSSGYYYGPGDMRVDPAGNAHFAFHHHDNEDPHHVFIPPHGPAVENQIATSGLNSHDGWDNSLAIGPLGQVHLACINPFGAVDTLQYGSFDGSSWTMNDGVTGSGTTMYGLNTSLAIDSNGVPHIAYCISNDFVAPGTLVYATHDTQSNFAFNTVVTGNGVGRFPSLALDSLNRVHLAWFDVNPANPSQAAIQYAIRENGTWTGQTVDVLNNVNMGFSGARKSISLALDTNDVPHLAYSDQRLVRYAHLDGGNWNTTDVLSHTANTYNGLVVLRLDPKDVPGIVCWQVQGGTPGRVRLTRPLPPQFELFTVQQSSSNLLLEWGQAGDQFQYVVECTTDLRDTNSWTNISGTPMDALRFSTSSAGATNAYYRVRAVAQ